MLNIKKLAVLGIKELQEVYLLKQINDHLVKYFKMRFIATFFVKLIS
jgi:hypothetical protein